MKEALQVIGAIIAIIIFGPFIIGFVTVAVIIGVPSFLIYLAWNASSESNDQHSQQ